MMKRVLTITTGLLLCGVTTQAVAQDHERELLAPSLQVQFEKNPLYVPLNSTNPALGDSTPTARNNSFLKQYGATLSFPVKHDKVSFDLGLDFRFYEKSGVQDMSRFGVDSFGLNLKGLPVPMVYGQALFELPFEGLTASLSGRHRSNGDQRDADFDYRAKISYEWKNGIGLEGGWQHQQMNLDQHNDNEVFRVESLFVDMKYKF
ncbi:MAG: hypothetical protein OEZ39_15290 [Gammaproteobacteria bacterium]|nr:hypothetical protein [Gammaproteobacteria bacterium]